MIDEELSIVKNKNGYVVFVGLKRGLGTTYCFNELKNVFDFIKNLKSWYPESTDPRSYCDTDDVDMDS